MGLALYGLGLLGYLVTEVNLRRHRGQGSPRGSGVKDDVKVIDPKHAVSDVVDSTDSGKENAGYSRE